MTEPTDNEALVEELADVICEVALGGVFIADAEDAALAILPIITRRDAETWNRAIENASMLAHAAANNWMLPMLRSTELRDAIARLKDKQ